MPRKRFTPEQFINKLSEAEVRLAQGETVPEVWRALAVLERTLYRWRKEFGGLKLSQARKLKELERENAQLKRLVAELALVNHALKEQTGTGD